MYITNSIAISMPYQKYSCAFNAVNRTRVGSLVSQNPMGRESRAVLRL